MWEDSVDCRRSGEECVTENMSGVVEVKQRGVRRLLGGEQRRAAVGEKKQDGRQDKQQAQMINRDQFWIYGVCCGLCKWERE